MNKEALIKYLSVFLAVGLTLSIAAFATPAVAVKANSYSPTQSIAPGRIAYTSSFWTGNGIFIMNSDGSSPIQLATNPYAIQDLSFSPDGAKIAYDADISGPNFDIFTMNADGAHNIDITNNLACDCEPTWSPDGTKIAFASNRDGNFQIYIMNSDGSNVVRLTNDSYSDTYPAWSPDGSKIAFLSNRDFTPPPSTTGIPFPIPFSASIQLYIMNTDGSNVERLTHNLDCDCRPAWSPDSTKIAFTASSINNALETYVINSDGNNQTLLADGVYPAWSPDGTQIAYVGAPQDIYVMNADGTNPTKITSVSGNYQNLTWSTAPVASSIINANSGPGGSITPSGEIFVNRGDNQSLVITNNTGYHVTNVSVDGISQGAVYSYIFNNVTSNHTISASFAPNANPPPWDINGDHVCDVRDLGAIASHIGQTGSPGWIPEDVNMDGIIDVRDLGTIGAHIGQTWSMASFANYYTINNGSNPFTRSLTPITQTSGNSSISQSLTSNGSIQLNISNATGYADCGFYLYAGPLQNLNTVTVQAAAGSSPFGLNLWFDRDGDGEYFNWNENSMSSLGNDAYILGPTSQNGVLTVGSSTQFDSLNPGGGNYTLAQLQSGAAPGINGNTPVAIWIGITTGSGGSLSSTISSVSIK
jgi:Tol biopolymer transport system component